MQHKNLHGHSLYLLQLLIQTINPERIDQLNKMSAVGNQNPLAENGIACANLARVEIKLIIE